MAKSKKRKCIKETESSTGENPIESIEEDDIIITTDTLQQLLKNPNHLRSSKQLKELRTTLFQALAVLQNITDKPSSAFSHNDNIGKLSKRVTDSLQEKAWDSAIYHLNQLETLGKIPKLGSVQRWIRLASFSRECPDIYYPLIAKIIRCADPLQKFDIIGETAEKLFENDTCYMETYSPFVAPTNKDALLHPNDYDRNRPINFNFYLVTDEKGLDDETHIKIYSSRIDDVFKFSQSPIIEKFPIPFVQDSFVLTNVFTKTECAQLIHAAEEIGFMHDYGYSFSQDMTYGAAGCVWIMDQKYFLDPIFERVKSFLPETIMNGKKRLFGLNARFRFYRYSHDASYRPHVDGSWPGSGLIKQGDSEIYKFDQYGDKVWSAFTFLIYLNDDFEGGHTTFFWPGQQDDGILKAKGIRPCAGNVLVFPHGDTAGALVHEGSLVSQGFKFVIRTDILYEKCT